MAKNNLLKEPKSFLGAKPLLFDRLIDDQLNDFDESSTSMFLSFDKIKESIQVELLRLLNTRAKTLKEDSSSEESTYGGPSFYGLPDFSAYDATNSQDWPKIASFIKNSIDRFEPRLKNITVSVIDFDSVKQKLNVSILGALNIKKIEGEVTFDVAIDCNKDL
ncbi:MAG: type VI secretion system baseplate subunit TssE [Proteobacteria bacterium]|nr:type VI secretion system baseplate subunit TssE [Pseudomonadota bacterium]